MNAKDFLSWISHLTPYWLDMTKLKIFTALTQDPAPSELSTIGLYSMTDPMDDLRKFIFEDVMDEMKF